MLTLEKQSNFISCALSTDRALVELFSHILNDILVYDQVPSATELTMVARELLTNAAVHGNKSDSQKMVSFRLENKGIEGFEMTVSDEGDGFDYKNLDTSIPNDPRRLRKKGYAVIGKSATRILFGENGRRVTVYMKP